MNDDLVVMMNNDYEDRELSIHVSRLGIPDRSVLTRLMLTTEEGYVLDKEEYTVRNNTLTIKLPKISSVVIKYDK